MEEEPKQPGLEDCLKLLRGGRDEQRLAGLLLATKFCKGDDKASVTRVYEAVGPRFLHRLLKTGTGTGTAGAEDREAYLRLSITILAGFCRVPEIASSRDMVSKVPLVLDVMSNISDLSLLEESYEFLVLVAMASEDGVIALHESGAMKVFATQVSTLPDGSQSMEFFMRILQLMLTKLPLDIIFIKYKIELSCMVGIIARQFALLHNALKFDALHLLTTLLSSKHSEALYDVVKSTSGDVWATYVRVGVIAVLRNRVASSEKLQALTLAESMLTIFSGSWLLEQNSLPDVPDSLPADRCLLLVLESSRIEVAVLLNYIASLKYGTSTSSSTTAESIFLEQKKLAVSFSLIERIIKLISDLYGAEENPINESTSTKVIAGLNETIGLVLDFLQDAKDHGEKKGNDLLASVRIIGSYLAESPLACKEKVSNLLEYMLSVEGEDEPSPFYSICFLLPILCQITIEVPGRKALASFGGHKSVIACFVKLIELPQMVQDIGTIFLACDTIMNLLLHRDDIRAQLHESQFIPLLEALAGWTVENEDPAITTMASSLCSLIFDLTSQDALLSYTNFKFSVFDNLSRLIIRSLDAFTQEGMSVDDKEHDLLQIVVAEYSSWADRYPLIKQAVEGGQAAFNT
ncbi:hypothetical protein QJS10_CPA06g02295 [Acorus calamus]|uniref:Neurochondrin n=1 Tax=Acorus calamus TaxID=4465 RepID=A0AAV9ELK0_ACOCL|nr:hypothetical protein QJS10_CPA06g02295 [Acorus calamus]